MIFHLNILVFQTNGKQPCSFSVFSRFCNGLWDSLCLYNGHLKGSRKCLLGKRQWLIGWQRVNPWTQAWEEVGWQHGLALKARINYYILNYMANSVSGQDEPNRTLCLATRAVKMELSFPLWTTRRVPREKFPWKPNNKFFIDQAFSVKMAGWWTRSFFCEFMNLDSGSVHKRAKRKKEELGQFKAIFTG